MLKAVAESGRMDVMRSLNDRLRRTGAGGVTLVSDGIASLPSEEAARIYQAVKDFREFNPDNDPWSEHDCASVIVGSHKVIWKIDYYDRQMQFHSPDPADEKQTVRVLTIMLADEY